MPTPHYSFTPANPVVMASESPNYFCFSSFSSGLVIQISSWQVSFTTMNLFGQKKNEVLIYLENAIQC